MPVVLPTIHAAPQTLQANLSLPPSLRQPQRAAATASMAAGLSRYVESLKVVRRSIKSGAEEGRYSGTGIGDATGGGMNVNAGCAPPERSTVDVFGESANGWLMDGRFEVVSEEDRGPCEGERRIEWRVLKRRERAEDELGSLDIGSYGRMEQSIE